MGSVNVDDVVAGLDCTLDSRCPSFLEGIDLLQRHLVRRDPIVIERDSAGSPDVLPAAVCCGKGGSRTARVSQSIADGMRASSRHR